MTAHEKAIKTYEALKKRKELKKQQELQHRMDASATGWNGYTKHMVTNLKRYY